MKCTRTLIFSLSILLIWLAGQTACFAATIAVTITQVTDIGEQSATVKGRIIKTSSDFFLRGVDKYGIYWNKTGIFNPATDKKIEIEDDDTGLPKDFSIEMKGLDPGTTYYVRAFADPIERPPVFSAPQSFTTLQKPKVSTQAVTNIGSTVATGNGTISALGHPAPTQHGVCWDTRRDPTIDGPKTQEGKVTAAGAFTSRMTGLKADTKYYVRAYATNTAGTVYGKQKDFRTQAGSPVVSTQAATQITTASALANATLVNAGTPPATQHGVCWGEQSLPAFNPANCIDRGPAQAEGPFQVEVTGLDAGTTYYLRAFASNETGVYHYGQEIFFATLELPAVATLPASGINTNEATANGDILDTGNPDPASHGICWRTANDPEECIDLGAAGSPGPFESLLTDLIPGTLYHVRAYAANDVGTAYGEEQSFTTVDEATAPRAALANAPQTPTRQTEYQLQVAGEQVTAYRYSLDGGPWSEPQDINTLLDFDITEEGQHRLLLLGRDDAGLWQPRQSASAVTWTLDTTPSAAKLLNYPAGTVGPFSEDIPVGGPGVAAYRYRLDDNSWGPIYPTSVPIQLPKLQDGPHALAVVGADLAGNWQAADQATQIEWTVDAGVPTAVLTNKPASVTSRTSMSIGVGAPAGGVPVTQYYYQFEDSDGWTLKDAAEPIQAGWEKEGQHTLCVNAGNGESWQDGFDGQSSPDSATCHTWRIDLTPVDPVLLYAQKGPPLYIHPGLWVASRAVALSWSWQSEDEREAIQRYRIWHSENAITENTLHEAVELFYARQPGPQGHMESFVVQNLAAGKTHYFAVKAIDKAGNSSGLSNLVQVTLDDHVPEITGMAFVEGGLSADNASLATLVLTGTNILNHLSRNFVRFENNDADFLLPATLGEDGKLRVQIPLGMPTDIYWVRMVNANGVSHPGPEMVTIVDAETPLPAVRDISPRIAAIGTTVDLTIKGEHFAPSAVSLVAMDGKEYDPVYGITVLDGGTLNATVVTDDLPEGAYDIRVNNTDTEYNQFSAVQLELYTPKDLNNLLGGIETDKIVQLEGGVVPMAATLKTRENLITGTGGNHRLNMKMFLMPGLTFEVEPSLQEQALPYHGHLLPPRETEALDRVVARLGDEAVQFAMGADVPLQLKTGTAFASLEVTVPSYAPPPQVYYIGPDNELELAGVQGTWQGIDIEKGGTVLSTRTHTPEEGLTTYHIGLMIDHLSDYAIGSAGTGGTSRNDDYGPCFIGAAR